MTDINTNSNSNIIEFLAWRNSKYLLVISAMSLTYYNACHKLPLNVENRVFSEYKDSVDETLTTIRFRHFPFYYS